MEFRGASAYDEQDFLAGFMKRRNRQDSPNNAIEGPVINELIGNVQSKVILDLGCGDAEFGKELLEAGARWYEGVEGSLQMVQAARKNIPSDTGIIHQKTMESYQFPTDHFDLITSRMSIHYLPAVDNLFQQIYNSLKTGGKFVFSIQHPITTSSFESKQSGERRSNWVVDDYFREGERKEPWIEKVIVKYHRTTEHYFNALINAGFTVTAVREGHPKLEHFSSEEEFQRRQRIPVVLIFSCHK